MKLASLFWACALLAFRTFATTVSFNNSRQVSDQKYPQQNDMYKPVFDERRCEVQIEEKSVRFFKSRLEIYKPDFIRIDLQFGSYIPNYTPETFQPFTWYWTYKTSRGLYPYLHWNIDYQILSFELLDEKTLKFDPYIQFHVSSGCNLTMGILETTELIANQLRILVSELETDNRTVSKYQESYWCYLAEKPDFRSSFAYKLGQYLLFQSSFINYNCCTTSYNYTGMRYHYSCNDEQVEKWIQCTGCPYILGLLLFLYCPFVVCNTKLWTGSQRQPEEADDDHTHLLNTDTNGDLSDETECGTDLVYLDGRYPITFGSVFANMVTSQHSVIISRLKRLAFVILSPVLLLVQIAYYNIQMSEEIKALIAHEVPVGFLALLGETSSMRDKTFVPVFGGPVTMLVSYYVFGILFTVLPRSLKDIIESGLPTKESNFSPLLFNSNDVKRFSKINIHDDNGYARAGNFLLYRLYSLFNGAFWKFAIQIQRERVKHHCTLLSVVLLPLYLSCCVIELFICALFYSVPVLGFITLLIRGVINTSNAMLRERILPVGNALRKQILISLCSAFTTIVLLFYVYSVCLVFLQSFLFVSQIIIYCYIAIVIFPAASFGYLFFVVVLVYYIFRLIRGFGANYLELLCDTVDIISRTAEQDGYLSVLDKSLLISDFRIKEIKTIFINNVKIQVPLESQRELVRPGGSRKRQLIYQNNTYGVRRDLFNYIVKSHLPVHQQALKVIFHLVVIFFFLLITISLTTSFCRGPVSEMSDVMHVVFVVIVGALPRVLEVVLRESSEHVYREIKLRQIEGTVNDFWQTLETHDSRGLNNHMVAHRSSYNSIN